jgi:outer membrane protein assembly factor BamB
MLTDSGMLSALDAKTGTPHYQQQRLPKPYQFKASPIGADGKLYLATEMEDVVVVRMGPKFEVLATNTLKDQTFIASPAIVDGEIYLRGQNTLFAIR